MPNIYKTILAVLTAFAACSSSALTKEQCENSVTFRGFNKYHIINFNSEKKPFIAYQKETLGPTGGGFYFCEDDLFAFVGDSRTVQKTTLEIEQISSYQTNSKKSWLERVFNRFSQKSWSYDLNGAGTETLQFRNGYIEIHDNFIENKPWLPEMGDLGDGEINSFISEAIGKPGISVTKNLIFDMKTRSFLQKRIVFGACPNSANYLAWCSGGLYYIDRNSIYGYKKKLLDYDFLRQDSTSYFGKTMLPTAEWLIGKRVFFMTDEQKNKDSTIEAKDIYEVINSKAYKFKQAPSPHISYTINIDEMVYFFSVKDKKFWSLNIDKKQYNEFKLNLDDITTEISHVSTTKDHFVIVQNLKNSKNSSHQKISFIDKSSLIVASELIIDEPIYDVTTYFRPQRSNRDIDGPRYAPRKHTH